MKRLIIMRHATTPDGSPDHARPLSAHGQAEALSVARQLASLAWVPQKIWCSDATRTTQTCQQLLSVFPALAASTSSGRASYTFTPTATQAWRWVHAENITTAPYTAASTSTIKTITVT